MSEKHKTTGYGKGGERRHVNAKKFGDNHFNIYKKIDIGCANFIPNDANLYCTKKHNYMGECSLDCPYYKKKS